MIIETSINTGPLKLPELQISALLPKANSKFFISWIASSCVMFTMFCFWHGMVLNDFMRIAQPEVLFYAGTTIVYLSLGYIITTLTYALKKIKHSFKYGLIIGASMGLAIYVLIWAIGFSFYPNTNLTMAALDFGWQIAEQAAGGLICGWVYRFMYTLDRAHSGTYYVSTCRWLNRL